MAKQLPFKQQRKTKLVNILENRQNSYKKDKNFYSKKS